MLQYAVLVDTGRVCKRISTHNGLIGLHRHVHQLRHQPARAIDQWGHDVGVHRNGLVAFDGHHHFLQGGIAGALANAVDGYFYLPCSLLHAGHGIGRSHAQVVVAMCSDDGSVDIGHPVFQTGNDGSVLFG